MVDAYKFRDSLLTTAPKWLRRTNGYRLLFSIGTTVDALADAASYAVQARYPGMIDPVHTLPRIGKDRMVRRGLFESTPSYARRLRNHLNVNRRRGLGVTMLEQIKQVLDPGTVSWFPECSVSFIHNRGTYAPPNHVRYGSRVTIDRDGVLGDDIIPWWWDDTGDFSRFWVVLSSEAPMLLFDGQWGDAGNWGDGGYWGVYGDCHKYIQNVLSVIEDFTPAHMQLDSLILVDTTNEAAFWASPPDGAWDRWENRNPAALYV